MQVKRAEGSVEEVRFQENGPLDVNQLNDLYEMVGWNPDGRRTAEETEESLRRSYYYIAAHTSEGRLVGFARVCGDPYVVQVLDVITHIAYRRRGIGTRLMQGVLNHLQRADYISVTLTDSSGLRDFYRRFGFQTVGPETPTRLWVNGSETYRVREAV